MKPNFVSKFSLVLAVCALPFAASSASAGSLDSSVSKMERIINNNIPTQYRGELNQALGKIKRDVDALPDSCRSSGESDGIACRAISTVTLVIKGVGTPEDTQLEAEDSARQNCRETARFSSDCDYVRYECEKSQPGVKHICSASSKITLQHTRVPEKRLLTKFSPNRARSKPVSRPPGSRATAKSPT